MVTEKVYIYFNNSYNTCHSAIVVIVMSCAVFVQVTSKLESENKLVLVEKGADFESTVTFEVSGDQLTVVSVTSHAYSDQIIAR